MPNEASSKGVALVDLKGVTLAKNTILSFVGLAIPYLVAFISIPFVIKALGVERFGILSLVWLVFGYFSFFDLGLGRTTTKYVSEALGRGEIEKLPHYVWTTVIMQLLFGGLGTIILIVVSPLLAENILNIPAAYLKETKITFFLVAFSLPINFVMNSFRGTLEAGQKFGLVNIVKIPASILYYLLPLVGVVLGFSLPGIVVLLILSRLAALIAWALLAIKTYPVLHGKPTLQKTYIKPLFNFSIWIAISNIIYSIVTSLDKLIIGSMLSVKEVAYYSAPSEAIVRLGIIPGSFSLILFPAFSSLTGADQHDKTEKLFSRASKYLLMITGPILVLILCHGTTILQLWLGREFSLLSSLVAKFLAAGMLVSSLWTVPFSYLQGAGRVHVTTRLQFYEALFYIFIVYLFIKRWGINGAAAATAIRISLSTLVIFFLAMRFGRIRLRHFFNRHLSSVIFILFLFWISLLASQRLHLGILAIFILTILMFLSFFMLSLDYQEKKMLLNVLRNILPRTEKNKLQRLPFNKDT